MYLLLFVLEVIHLAVGTTQTQNSCQQSSNSILISTSVCSVENAFVDFESAKQICCKDTVHNFKTTWSQYGTYLTVYLETLMTWNCSEFTHECRDRNYVINDFTNLVYLYFCNLKSFNQRCSHVIDQYHNKSTEIDPVKDVDSSEITEPCIQVSLYNATLHDSSIIFNEIVEVIIPFCEFVWCGFDNETMETRQLTAWDCMPSRYSKIYIDVCAACISWLDNCPSH